MENRTNVRLALEEIEGCIRAYRAGQIVLFDLYICLVTQVARLGREIARNK